MLISISDHKSLEMHAEHNNLSSMKKDCKNKIEIYI